MVIDITVVIIYGLASTQCGEVIVSNNVNCLRTVLRQAKARWWKRAGRPTNWLRVTSIFVRLQSCLIAGETYEERSEGEVFGSRPVLLIIIYVLTATDKFNV